MLLGILSLIYNKRLTLSLYRYLHRQEDSSIGRKIFASRRVNIFRCIVQIKVSTPFRMFVVIVIVCKTVKCREINNGKKKVGRAVL